MIDIQIIADQEDILKVTVRGHAGYGEEGTDIICAAVSMLMVNTVNAIEAFTEDDFTCDQGDGFMELTVEEEASSDTKLLMKTLHLGLQSILDTYGKTFLDIVTKEV